MAVGPCRPVRIVQGSDFWIGVVVGVILTLLLGKVMGWLVF